MLHDRWMVEAALGWDDLMTSGNITQTVNLLAPMRAELQRRDIDSWLRLELHILFQQEAAAGARNLTMRSGLLDQCRRYGAAGIEREIVG